MLGHVTKACLISDCNTNACGNCTHCITLCLSNWCSVVMSRLGVVGSGEDGNRCSENSSLGSWNVWLEETLAFITDSQTWLSTFFSGCFLENSYSLRIPVTGTWKFASQFLEWSKPALHLHMIELNPQNIIILAWNLDSSSVALYFMGITVFSSHSKLNGDSKCWWDGRENGKQKIALEFVLGKGM